MKPNKLNLNLNLNLNIIPITTTIGSYKYSFYPCCIQIWNQLPTTPVTALTPAAFRDSALPTIRMLCPQAGSKLL